MKKVFISQPMNGRPDEEIKEERQCLINQARLMVGEEVNVIDSFFEGAPHDARPLWFLGKSLQLMSQADIVVFGEGWQDARGCKIEHTCAVEYGIDRIEP